MAAGGASNRGHHARAPSFSPTAAVLFAEGATDADGAAPRRYFVTV
ncbi:hypothetical protein [Streptomyces avermitilis]